MMRTRNVLLAAGAIALVGKIGARRTHSVGHSHHHDTTDHRQRCGVDSMLTGSEWQGLTEVEAREKLSPLVGDGNENDRRAEIDDAVEQLRERGYLAEDDTTTAGT